MPHGRLSQGSQVNKLKRLPRPLPANRAQDSAALQADIARIAAYERGLERGLQTAERQVRMAAELARTILAAVPAPSAYPDHYSPVRATGPPCLFS